MANIVEAAVSAGMFETLVAAVKAAGLVETLSGPGPFTVFAPNDDAGLSRPNTHRHLLGSRLARRRERTAIRGQLSDEG